MRQIGSSGDNGFRRMTLFFGIIILFILVFMVFELFNSSFLSIAEFGIGFLTGEMWNPQSDVFGALPFIFGTIMSSVIALLIAAPISVGIAIFLVEVAPPWFRTPVGFLVELLAAIPSIVYGLWGIFVLSPIIREYVAPPIFNTLGFLPIFKGPSHGVGLFTAGLILAIMIIPTITSISREVISAVPNDQREAVLALGSTKWEMIRVGVLSSARAGILGAMIIGLGRAIGETMAVTMVIGNRNEIPTSIFQPAQTMASLIANEFAEATSNLHISALLEIGLVLFGVTLILNVFARFLVWSVSRTPKRGS